MPLPQHAPALAAARKALGFVVPPGQSILCIGEASEPDFGFLLPRRLVVCRSADAALLSGVEGTFDYVILLVPDGGPGTQAFLLRLATHCAPATRIIACGRNRMPAGKLMADCGYELTRARRPATWPSFAPGLEVYRRLPRVDSGAQESVTICLACRDERENIEPLVRAIPQLSLEQEILFIEGHSTDGTLAEIERCMALYPDRNIRVLQQPGYGKADAVRAGFGASRGSVIILLEADMTSPPEDIRAVYDAIRLGQAEYLGGSRFASGFAKEAMPWLNRIGNRLFALWFSRLLGQPISDTLCGIKALRKSDYERIAERWGQWGAPDPFGDFELLLGAARLGLKIGETPIRYVPRSYGASKTRVFHHGAVLARISLSAFSKLRA
jgi:hypothetical protein